MLPNNTFIYDVNIRQIHFPPYWTLNEYYNLYSGSQPWDLLSMRHSRGRTLLAYLLATSKVFRSGLTIILRFCKHPYFQGLHIKGAAYLTHEHHFRQGGNPYLYIFEFNIYLEIPWRDAAGKIITPMWVKLLPLQLVQILRLNAWILSWRGNYRSFMFQLGSSTERDVLLFPWSRYQGLLSQGWFQRVVEAGRNFRSSETAETFLVVFVDS